MASSERPFHIRYLNEELERRKKRNPHYSLRAFALFLRLDPGSLSRILTEKNELSLVRCTRISDRLALTEENRRLFMASVAADRTQRTLLILQHAVSDRELGASSDRDEAPMGQAEVCEAMLKMSSEWIYVLDEKRRFIFSNPAGALLAGKGCHEMVSHTLAEVGLPERLSVVLESLRQSVMSGRDGVWEAFDLGKGSDRRRFDAEGVAIACANGQSRACLIRVHDITRWSTSGQAVSP